MGFSSRIAKALAARGWIGGYSHAFSMTDALGAVVEGPVITGVEWQDTMDTAHIAGMLSFLTQETWTEAEVANRLPHIRERRKAG